MKNRHKFILSLVLLLLCGLVWWLKRPVPLPPVPVQAKSLPPSTPDAVAGVDPPQSKAAAAATSQAKAAPSGNAVPKRKFSEMDVLDRGVIMKEIRNKDLAAIFQHFLDASRVENDGMKQSGLRGILAEEIQNRKPDPVFLKKLQEFIESEAPSELERGMMLDALREAGTKETGELLLHEATTLKNTKVRGTAINCLSMLGNTVRTRDKGEIDQALTRAWKATNDPGLMAATARSMARIGSADSVELLLTAALAPDGQDDERRSSADYALRKVCIFESAVPPLAAVLEKNPVGSQGNTLAYEILSHLGPEAQKAVLKWLQTTDASAAPLATKWAISNRAGDVQKFAQAALDPAVPFRSEENRQAIRAGLEAYRAEELRNKR